MDEKKKLLSFFPKVLAKEQQQNQEKEQPEILILKVSVEFHILPQSIS